MFSKIMVTILKWENLELSFREFFFWVSSITLSAQIIATSTEVNPNYDLTCENRDLSIFWGFHYRLYESGHGFPQCDGAQALNFISFMRIILVRVKQRPPNWHFQPEKKT